MTQRIYGQSNGKRLTSALGFVRQVQADANFYTLELSDGNQRSAPIKCALAYATFPAPKGLRGLDSDTPW